MQEPPPSHPPPPLGSCGQVSRRHDVICLFMLPLGTGRVTGLEVGAANPLGTRVGALSLGAVSGGQAMAERMHKCKPALVSMHG